MAVPNNETFTLQNVVDEVNPTTDDLVDCFADAITNHFNKLYYPSYRVEGPHALVENSLLNFRDYSGALRPPEAFSIFTRKHTTLLWTWTDNAWDETGYYIERSDDGVTGWVEVETTIANAQSYLDTGLTYNTTYYYRIRTFNGDGNSDWISGYAATLDVDSSTWFLPSRNELRLMYQELKYFGYGFFDNDNYWCSTEYNYNNAIYVNFSTGAHLVYAGKSSLFCVRACRTFTGEENDYELRDIGPGGGYIFNIVDEGGGDYVYYEAAAANQSDNHIWSDASGEIEDTVSTVGFGMYNSLLIITQSGHTESAAKICIDI